MIQEMLADPKTRGVVVGTYEGVEKTMMHLVTDYRKELVQAAAVAVAAVQDFEHGSAVLDGMDGIFDEMRIETETYLPEDFHPPTEWVTILGKRFGAVCDSAINHPDLPHPGAAYRRNLIWFAEIAITAYAKSLERPISSANVTGVVRLERERQNGKWGPQHREAPYWAAILGEEVGEACEAALRVDDKLVRDVDGGRQHG